MPKDKIIAQKPSNQIFIYLVSAVFLIVLSCTNQEERKEELKQQNSSPIQAHEYEISKSEVNFVLTKHQDSTYSSFALYRNRDSITYNHFKYNSSVPGLMLKDHIDEIMNMWSVAQDSVNIELKSLMVGYPLLYDDVLDEHINAFIKSDKWDVKKKGVINESYQVVRDIMKEANVYSSINLLLETNGYSIKQFSTEKHGLVLPSELSRLGYDSTLSIPVPYMVWIEVEKR